VGVGGVCVGVLVMEWGLGGGGWEGVSWWEVGRFGGGKN